MAFDLKTICGPFFIIDFTNVYLLINYLVSTNILLTFLVPFLYAFPCFFSHLIPNSRLL